MNQIAEKQGTNSSLSSYYGKPNFSFRIEFPIPTRNSIVLTGMSIKRNTYENIYNNIT